MKKENLYEVLGEIKEDYISEAYSSARKKSRSGWRKWGVIAACIAVILTAATAAWPTLFGDINTPTSTVDNEMGTEELGFSRRYVYGISEGKFSAYVGGKVIAEDKLGSKVEDVSVTAGWINAEGEWLSTENLRGEVYSIAGISNDVAVALKFLDKGEAVTTTHYYVIMNPDADLAAVEEYIIQPMIPNNIGDE